MFLNKLEPCGNAELRLWIPNKGTDICIPVLEWGLGIVCYCEIEPCMGANDENAAYSSSIGSFLIKSRNFITWCSESHKFGMPLYIIS